VGDGLEQGFRDASARGVAAVIEYLGKGKALAVPPAGPGEPWTVLVDPYPRGAGGLVVLRTLRDAVPFVAGLVGLPARRAGVYGPGAEAEARRALDEATRPAGEEADG